MTHLDSLVKIKKAEEEAGKIIEKANGDKNKIIADAKRKAAEMLENNEQKMKEEREAQLKEVEGDFSKKQVEKTNETLEKIERMKIAADIKISKEAGFLYKKFVEMIIGDEA